MKKNSSLEKFSLFAVAAVVSGLAFFGGYHLISYLGHVLAWNAPPLPISEEVAESSLGAGPLLFSDGSGRTQETPRIANPSVSEKAKALDSSSTLTKASPIDPAHDPVSAQTDVVAIPAPLQHRERVDGRSTDLHSTTPRSIVISAAGPLGSRKTDTPPSGTEIAYGRGRNAATGSPSHFPVSTDSSPIDVDLLVGPVILSDTAVSNLADTKVTASLSGTPEIPASVEAGSLLPEAGSLILSAAEKGSEKMDGVADLEIGLSVAADPVGENKEVSPAPSTAPPAPAIQREGGTNPKLVQKRAPARIGTIYGNALGGSVSGLIGGLSAPPLDSEVNYRPADPSVSTGGRKANPFAGTNAGTLPPIFADGPVANAAIPRGTVPAMIPRLNSNVLPGGPNHSLPQTGSVLPPEIGIGIGGLDVRVNTSIDIR